MSKMKFEKVIKKMQAEFKKLRKFCKYIKKVFKFEEIAKAQKDSRKKRNYETSVIFIIVFWGFVFRVPSFNKLEEMIKYGCFNPLFPRKTILPSIDTIGKVLAKLDLEALERSFQKVIRTLYLILRTIYYKIPLFNFRDFFTCIFNNTNKLFQFKYL